MEYRNPILTGFYPDPSICRVGGKYYMVCSSFQYFPGVPLFESVDLINWHQIGHCLTRSSQIQLKDVASSGGVFAPTIRHHNGRFYMVTTNDTTRQNFYVYTDQIDGEWSDPVFVQQGGIDPSLLFDEENVFFLSNGEDDFGVPGIVQCEINIVTGEKLTPSRAIWQGTGGRFLEAPHMYKIQNYYYLLAAEGGTEYGHMTVYARGKSPYGPFEAYPGNPVLTNRNAGGFEVQGTGHGDLVQDENGNWWMIHLGFRQIGRYAMYHHLGREVFLTPIHFKADEWFSVDQNGMAMSRIMTDCIKSDVVQRQKTRYTFENTQWDQDWCYLRIPVAENYQLGEKQIQLQGTKITLDEIGSPTFIGLRQKEFNCSISCRVSVSGGEAGLTLYMDENHHYDLGICKTENGYAVVRTFTIGSIKSIQNTSEPMCADSVLLKIYGDANHYRFYAQTEKGEYDLGEVQTKYLSSEVAGGFTGVIIGLYAVSEDCSARFTEFECEFKR